MKKLSDLKNVGKATLKYLALLDIDTVEELAKQNPTLLFHELERRTHKRQDPCMWDLFAAIIHESTTEEPTNWWAWTNRRKALQKNGKLKHVKLFHLLEENVVDLSANIGEIFHERPKGVILPFERVRFLRELGCHSLLDLTPREKDILKLLANGFPSSYIKEELRLGIRTVENYIAAIKSKLSCRSKVELIKKAQEIASTGLLNTV